MKSDVAAPRQDPTAIGEVSAPPFARLPDPSDLFGRRALRFRDLSASGHELGPYLAFLADLSDAQHAVEATLPAGELPSPSELDRSRAFRMPALDRNRFPLDPAFNAALDALFEVLAPVDMPVQAREALAVIRHADRDGRARMAQAVLDNAIPFEAVAEHVFIAAGLQLHAARLAARLEPASLTALEGCVCPACGSAPTSSLVVGWHGAHGARFCSCSLCGTLWNYVRVRCTACGSTEGVSHPEIDGSSGGIKAECCDQCRSSLKILYQMKEPALDPVADDVASLALDLLVAEDGYRRSGANPYLVGY